MKKAVTMWLALVLAFSMLAGCGRNGGKENEDTGDQKGNGDKAPTQQTGESVITDEFTFAALRFPKSLDASNRSATDQGVFMQLYEMLFYNDFGTPVAWLADASKGEFGGYDHEEGTADYTVYIYDYITDSAGNNLTAKDVVFSYNTAYGKSGQGPWNDLESVEATDTYTVVFHCKEELTKTGQLAKLLANCYLFTEAGYNASPSQLATDSCGTGCYTLKSFVSGNTMIMERREDYWQKEELCNLDVQKANAKIVEFQCIAENAQRVIALETGALDAVEVLDPSYSDEFRDGGKYGDKFDVVDESSDTIYLLSGNLSSNSICSDANLRKAIFYAVDNENLVKALGGNYYACKAFGVPNYEDYVKEWDGLENYCTTSGQKLVDEYLKKAGYNGEKIIFAFNSGAQNYAQIIQGMILNAGINVELYPVDGAAWTEVLADEKAWDLIFTFGSASDYTVNAWNSGISTSNYTTGKTFNFIDDAKYEELLQLCRTEEGHTEENMDQWWKYTVENAYTMPLFNDTFSNVYSSDIAKLSLNYKNYIIPGACTFTK